jgi:predicted transposase/invertase (TIGR01784 family)
MAYDNLCKLIAENHPLEIATWILGHPPEDIEILKTELSIEPIRADAISFFKTTGRILHIEFQTRWRSKPPIPLRSLDYWVRLHRQYKVPIDQYVILLCPSTEDNQITNFFQVDKTCHEFNIIRLWEEDPTPFLNNPVLLPFASLAQTDNRDDLIRQVAQQVDTIAEPNIRGQVASYVQILAGLRYDKNAIKRLFREEIMRESVIYQDILHEGELKGELKGRQESRQEIALKMLVKGTPIDLITEFTGLTIAEVQALAKSVS